MKQKATTFLLIIGFFITITYPVLAQNEALYVAPSGNVGLGMNSPERQLHLVGDNAVFRMDRSLDTAAFLLHRTQWDGTPMKTFVVGANAAGIGNGEFIINDLGSAVSGGGARRMTIHNDGDVTFTGAVYGADFFPTSSIRYKDNITRIEDPLALTQQLEGVRFNWKENGEPALGFIAEDVAAVLPEVIGHDEESGQVLGLNYSAVVPVLVEAIKEQQRQLEIYQARTMAQQAELTLLKKQLGEMHTMKAQLADIAELVTASHLKGALARN
jgi:hypothetical protein